jgi:hypothetical protein
MPIRSYLACQSRPPLLRNPGLSLCHPQMRLQIRSSWLVPPVSQCSQPTWHLAEQRLEDEGEPQGPQASPVAVQSPPERRCVA